MKKLFAILSLFIIAKLSTAQEKNLSYYLSQCPFKMPPVSIPEFSLKSFSIADFGAIADGKTLNTSAFAKAIDACEKAGGGTVNIPAGTWLTGPIEMKSNVNLHAEKNALIIFTPDRTQYPIIHSSKNSKGFFVHPPIYGENLQNIAISGDGIFDGSGEVWRPVKKSKVTAAQWEKFISMGGVLTPDGKTWWPSAEAMNGDSYLRSLKDKKDLSEKDYLPARDFLRPRMIVLADCNNVLLDGNTFRNSPMYVMYLQHCTNLTVRNVKVHNEYWAQNSDGIDISASKGVIIYNCTVNAGDDGICMKSSGGKGGDNFELENILIANCIVFQSHGGFVIGSNTDGGMRNIFVSDCNFIGSDIGVRVKSNGGRGGVVKDIYVQNIQMKDIVNAAISFDTYYEDMQVGRTVDSTGKMRNKIPAFRDFHFKNISCDGARSAIYINALPEMPAQKISFENITISANEGVNFNNASGIELKNVKVIPQKGSVYTLNNTNNVHIINGFFPEKSENFLTAKENVSEIKISGTDLRNSSSAIQFGKSIDKNAIKIDN